MRVVFLTQFFDPEPCYKGVGFVHDLQRCGHLVWVLTGFPNYPGGKVYNGYKVRAWQHEIRDGIPILRVAHFPSHDRSVVRRALNYLSFAGATAVLGPLLVPRPDVVLVYHPPATVGLAAVALRTIWRVPFVYDVQDLWPDTLVATGMVKDGWVLAAVGAACHVIYAAATRIVVLSPGFKRRLMERGVPPTKLRIIYNWSPEEASTAVAEPQPLPRDEAALLHGRFNVIFAGNMGPAQGLDAIIATAQILAPTDPDVRFVFVGAGIESDRLQQRARDLQATNVLFLPRRPVAGMAALLERADALLVHLRDDRLFTITIPSKSQAYLRAGRPIIMAVRGDAANLVNAAGAGITCPPENPAAIADAVRLLRALSPSAREAMGRAGASFYAKHLTLRRGAEQFARVLAETAEAAVGGRAI